MTETEKQRQLEKDMFDISNILNSQQDFNLPTALKSENLLKLLPDKPDTPKASNKVIKLNRLVPILATGVAAVFIVAIIPRLNITGMLPAASKDSVMIEETEEAVYAEGGMEPSTIMEAPAMGGGGQGKTEADDRNSQDAVVEDVPEEDAAETVDIRGELISTYFRGYMVSDELIEGTYTLTLYTEEGEEVDSLKINGVVTKLDDYMDLNTLDNFFYILLNNGNTNSLYKIGLSPENTFEIAETIEIDGQVVEHVLINGHIYVYDTVKGDVRVVDSYVDIPGSMEEESLRVTIVDTTNHTNKTAVIYNIGIDLSLNITNLSITAEVDTAEKESTAYFSYNFDEEEYQLDIIE